MNSNVYHFQEYLENSSPPWGYLRVLHAVPNAPNIDVYANDTLVFNDLGFGEYTDYMRLPEGRYKITVYVAGTINEPLLTNNLTNNEGAYLTIGVTGNIDDVGMVGIVDADMPADPGKAMIRFAHLSPNAPAVDITLQNGFVIFDDVSFREVTSYMDVLPMNYMLEVRGAGTSSVVLRVPVDAKSGHYYTIYAIGLLADEPELEALITPDGAEK